MSRFFNRERFGRPQILAGLLLLAFVGECLWLIAHQPSSAISTDELAWIEAGVAQWHGQGVAGTAITKSLPDGLRASDDDREHSPLWYLIGAAPVAPLGIAPGSALWIWLTHGSYVLFGTLLGGSLWYVSRRLYGNAGGYIALGLYCFSPTVIRASTLWFAQPDIAGAWGTFGAVFTAIAVAHTLYAPREVVLWNWRRIVLLGVSLALTVGSQFELAIIVPLLLGLMLYVAPERKTAAVAILGAACAVAIALLFAAYSFHPGIFSQSLTDAKLLGSQAQAFAMKGAYAQLGKEVVISGPVLAVLIPAALITYLWQRRSRYFGNTAQLMIALLFAALRVGSPHAAESIFSLLAVVFLLVFVAGISADLLETKSRELAAAVLAGLLGANAVWNVVKLAGIGF